MKRKAVILVDTSVFIDFFRNDQAGDLEALVLNNQVALSEYVKLEIMSGLRSSEASHVNAALAGLIQNKHDSGIFETAQKMLKIIKPLGLTVGMIDLLIAAEANFYGQAILSRDKIFQKLGALKLIQEA